LVEMEVDTYIAAPTTPRNSAPMVNPKLGARIEGKIVAAISKEWAREPIDSEP
jgi:hypothetical protein